MLGVERFGTEQLQLFVMERLVSSEGEPCHKKFHDPMKRSNPPTLANLYKVKKGDTKSSTMKVDRSILQRWVICYAAGQEVDLDSILKHELLPVPMSLAGTDGSLRDGDKHVLMEPILQRVNCLAEHNIPNGATLIIDGQAQVMAVTYTKQRQPMETFGDFGKKFCDDVYDYGENFSRIDVVFDRYQDLSIKEGTRMRREKMYTHPQDK